MRRLKIIVAASLSLSFVAGCSPDDKGDGLTQKDQAAISRLDQIAKSSGGDWDKLSDADKKYLINDISMGSEQSAKMLLKSKTGQLTATPGGAPKK